MCLKRAAINSEPHWGDSWAGCSLGCSAGCLADRCPDCSLSCLPGYSIGYLPSRCPRCSLRCSIRCSTGCSDHCGSGCSTGRSPRCSPRSSDCCWPDSLENRFPSCFVCRCPNCSVRGGYSQTSGRTSHWPDPRHWTQRGRPGFASGRACRDSSRNLRDCLSCRPSHQKGRDQGVQWTRPETLRTGCPHGTECRSGTKHHM